MNKDGFFEEEEGFIEALNKYQNMLKNKRAYFFDVYEFENIIDYYIDIHNLQQAKDAALFGIKQHPYSSALKLKYAQILIHNGKPSKGLSILRDIEQLESVHSEFHQIKGTAYNLLGKKKEAIESFSKAINLSHENKDEVIYNIAFSFIQIRKYEIAIKYLLLAFEINPANTLVIYELALCYERVENIEKSIFYYEKFVDQDPFAENIWFNLGVLYSGIFAFDKAIEAYDFAIAINPSYISAYFNKANTYISAEDFKNAIYVYKEIILFEPNNVQAYCYIGECYEKMGHFQQATYFYNKVIEIDENFSDAWFGKGMIEIELNNFTSSINFLKKAIKIDPENSEYWFMIGEAYKKTKQIKQSTKAYAKAVELDPNDYEAWLSYARLFLNNNKIDDALQILYDAYKYNNEIATINYELAEYHLYKNQVQIASEYFELGLKLNYNEHTILLSRSQIARDNKSFISLISKYRKNN